MRLAPLVSACLLACATASAPTLGEIKLQPYTQLGTYPVVYSVQQKGLTNPDVHARIGDDGCVTGMFRDEPLELCNKSSGPQPLEEGAHVERWAGVNGDLTLEVNKRGDRMRMDGYVGAPNGRGSVPLHTTVKLLKGPQWDEVRRYPVLIALAAAGSGMSGEPPEDAQSQ